MSYTFEEFKQIIVKHFTIPRDPRMRNDLQRLFEHTYNTLKQHGALNIFMKASEKVSGIVVDEFMLLNVEMDSGLYRTLKLERWINGETGDVEQDATLLFPRVDPMEIGREVSQVYTVVARSYKIAENLPAIVYKKRGSEETLEVYVPPLVDWEVERPARIHILNTVIDAVERELEGYGAIVKSVEYVPRTLLYNRALKLEVVLTKHDVQRFCEVSMMMTDDFHDISVDVAQERLTPLLKARLVSRRYLPIEKWEQVGSLIRDILEKKCVCGQGE